MQSAPVESTASKLPPLIPREILFGNPERVSPQLSPQGNQLAYLAPDDKDVLQVWLQTPEGEGDRQLTHDKKRGIRAYAWTYAGDQLVYLQDADGDENWHIYGVQIHKDIVRDLTPFEGVQARIVALDPFFPDQMLVALNLEDRSKHDVYRVNLRTGAIELDTENPGNIVGWTTDPQFQVRAGVAAMPDGGYDLLYRPSVDQDWQTLRHWGPDDEGGPVEFSADGKTLYIEGSHEANATRLLALDLETMAETVIAEDPQYDLGGVLIHPTSRQLQAVSFYRDKLEWQLLDPKLEPDFQAIAQLRRGEYRIVSRNLEDSLWLVAYLTDDGPVYYYQYDRPRQTSTLLFSNQPQLENLDLATMQPVAFESRDGLMLHGYLTTPVGIPAENLPTVLLVHGGPWVRDTWGYSPMVQWLANRGYAVLQVNYRGSTGYGKQFVNISNREWAGTMHDDLIDAVHWLVEQGIADRDRIAIMGGSYGGYATLVGLTFTPEVFAAGVDIVGPSNLVTLLQTVPPYWAPMKAMFQKRVGDLETEEDFLKSRSPLFFVDRIQKPLLIGQGANDPRVKQAESEQIVEAMQSARKPVEYIVYTDEGHGFARPENRLHFYAHAEEFLVKYLGGRAEAMTEIEGHSGIVQSFT